MLESDKTKEFMEIVKGIEKAKLLKVDKYESDFDEKDIVEQNAPVHHLSRMEKTRGDVCSQDQAASYKCFYKRPREKDADTRYDKGETRVIW